MQWTQRWRTWAQRLRRDAWTLWWVCRHPRTPWYVQLCAALAVAYALSPIDLIPDFIPVLGLLDEMLLLPLLVWCLLRWLPADVVAECRAQALAQMRAGAAKPRSLWGGALVLSVWALACAAVGWWWWQRGD